MSALPLKADIKRRGSHVRFVPIATETQCSKKSLLNHLVGAGKQRRRNSEAERLRGSQVL
jgi:hypothetical protein